MKNQMQAVKANKWIWQLLIPCILLLYPLLKSAVGVDYMDSMYSPGNFEFFPRMEGMWVVATFLANVIGYLLTALPGAGTYLGLRIYTNLIISILALVSYFWLKKKIPAGLVALGEIIAIGLCWCPATILYNYLTYLFMLGGLICLYEGLTREKKLFLILAGVCLGLNLFVRFPNLTETGFILAVWIYSIWKKKKFGQIAADTLWCMLGYFISVAGMLLLIMFLYGTGAYGNMIASLFSMTDSAASYKPVEMILAILLEFKKAVKWPAGMALYVLVCSGLFALFKNRFLWVKRGITVAGILVLLRWYYAKGMFNIKYYTYPSIFQWVMCFLILTILVLVAAVCFGKQDADWKLLCVLVLLTIAITPIGSNNNLFPVMNNLFLIAPVSLYALYQAGKKAGNGFCGFPVRAMLTAVVAALLVQSVGFGVVFSFRGAREGEKRDTKIEKNVILKGMYTNREKAQAIEELTVYWENRGSEGGLLLFGHIPGVSYFLHTPVEISTSWPDLASYSYDTYVSDMEALKLRLSQKAAKPSVIVSYGVAAVLQQDQEAMEWYEQNMDSGEEALELMLSDEKLTYLRDFLQQYGYERTLENQRFVVYEAD